jgi:peptidase M28-like protein
VTDYAGLLSELAVPRLVGTANHNRVRGILKRELVARGFSVEEHAFAAGSTRLGAVALAGAALAWGAIGAVLLQFVRHPWVGIGWIGTVLAVVIHVLVTARGRGDETLRGTNLIGRRPGSPPPTTWLVAHYDSKGQPISMATRLVAVALSLLGSIGLLAHAAVLLFVADPPVGHTVFVVAPALIGGVLLSMNQVTDGSPGAVDNATALVAVTMILDLLPPRADVGVLFPDAEELGLLGARALVEERDGVVAGTAVINFDGLDDRGRTITLVHRAGPLTRALGEQLVATPTPWLPVLVDGIELAAVARECVTIMKGGWATTRVVHTARDTTDRLTLAGAREVAEGVARVLNPA